MTVETTAARTQYTGNGVTTAFATGFKFIAAGDLVVTLTDTTTGVDTVQTLNTHYTVTGAAAAEGGTVTFITPPAASQRVTIERVTTPTQELDYVPNDPFPAESHESGLDKLTMLLQENRAVNNRTLRLGSGDQPTTLSSLPVLASRASRVLAFDANGQPTVGATIANINAAIAAFLGGVSIGEISSVGDITTLETLGGMLDGQVIQVIGYYAGTRVGGGYFQFVFGSSATVDNVLVFTAVGGRWFRILPPSATLTPFMAGATGDGAANDTGPMLAIIAACNALGLQLDLAGKTYLVDDGSISGGILDLPNEGIVGKGRITGAPCRWLKQKEVNTTGEFRCDELIIDSVWYSEFDRLWVNGDITFQSSDPTWGTFWNQFNSIRCDGFIIDVDQGQSINQNVFLSVRAHGGVHIRGTATTGTRAAHNNLFVSLDTTGANLTASDGTTGVHLLNDSNLNQANTVLNWYAEVSGSQRVLGNWNVLSSNVVSSGTTIMVGRTNHYLNAGNATRNGDFFAGTPVNRCQGGGWKIMQSNGLPVGVSLTGSGISSSIISVTDAPDGNPLALEVTAGGTFNRLNISYPYASHPHVELTAFVKIENAMSANVEIFRDSGNFSAGRTLVPVGNDWYLMRVAGDGGYLGDGGSGGPGSVRIFLTTSSLPSPAPKFTLGSFFLATEQTAFLPQWEQGQKIAYGTAAPNAGIWNRGDICWNTEPSGGGAPGWVCTAGGSPGTWKAMANLAA